MKVLYASGINLCVGIFILMLFSCNSERKKEALAQQNKPKPVPRVIGFVAQTQSISEDLELPGSLMADQSTDIHPEVSGRITGLYIREGANVSKGSLLAKLYDADLQAQKRKLEVQLQIAQQTSSRHEKLLSIGGISKEDFETTSLNVSNIRADLDVVKTAITKTEIRAPFSGKLGLRQVSVGAFVSPQTIISTIQKTSGLRIDFSIPEKYTSQVQKGKYINFTIEGTGRKYTAVVIATESGVSQATRNLMIRAQVKGDATGLVPGGFAKVQLKFDNNPEAIMVPSQAVIPQARGKQIVVYRNGMAKFIDITTGIRDSSMVEVTKGLTKGDTIVTTGLLSIKPDAKIALSKVTNH